ncbi:protease complex subunit PrcB family protein [Salinisphaera hydrothermalis]|uniref:protease complex subunit PrcB family protein n=1 Tax=Salinisphaera hydrothermalis TaxID=563188 RepID=UPI00333F394E
MSMMRLGLLLISSVALSACSVLHLGQSASGVSVVGKNEYCGTPSQQSEVHYFATPDAFQNWIDYRNISGFNPKMARNGVLIVEMGQRPTGGYDVELDGKKTGLKNGVLTVGMDWHAPRLDAAVSQAMITECVALHLPQGQYNKVRVVDQLGNLRGRVNLNRATQGS